jgi:mannosyltransferase OCH1-like enzyme
MFRWQQYTFHDDPSFRGVPASRPGEDPNLIPAIIHQSYKHDDISALPVAWQYAHESCKNMHPKYQIILWTDERVREFISTNYPHHLRNFDSYPYDIQRVDAARYFILYHYGGIYLDLDIECRKPLDAIRRHFGAVFPATKPFGVRSLLCFVLLFE